MRFHVDWQLNGPNAVPEERVTIADLRILIGDDHACANEQPRRRSSVPAAAANRNVRRAEYATVSVYPLAEEIALNWWLLFGKRDAIMRLADGRGGYALPDVQLAFDGAGFEAACLPTAYENPPVHFTCRAAERLTREEAEIALTTFIEQVRERLGKSKVRDSDLQLRWKRVLASRQDADEAAFCEAAGALGLDPYNVNEEQAEFIVNAGAQFCGEPLAELLSGLSMSGHSDWSSTSGHDVLAWLRAAEARPAAHSSLPAVNDWCRRGMADVRSATAYEMPWCVGYRCAKEVRRQLDIGAGERFDVSTLAARLGGSQFSVTGPVSGVRAVVETRTDATHVHLPLVDSPHRHTSELFALGRAVGDAVANRPAERSAVNDLRTAARQAAGRAFAAEFLAPIDEVLSMHEDGKGMDDMAEDFGVAKEVVERQWQNRQRIQEACAASAA